MDSTENTDDEPKIYRPKPKKLFIASTLKKHLNHKHCTKKCQRKFLLNSNEIKRNKDHILCDSETEKNKIDFSLLSLEEIEKDFFLFKAKSEELKVEKELKKLIKNSNKKFCDDNEFIERPKNPFYENFQ